MTLIFIGVPLNFFDASIDALSMRYLALYWREGGLSSDVTREKRRMGEKALSFAA
jgi:hypothetical protein